jgi:hypothetical protein
MEPASPPGRDERSMAMLCHLLSFAGAVFPFGNVIGPLVAWLMERKESRFVDCHGRRAVNFQISILIWMLVCVPLVFVGVGVLLVIGLAILDFACTIIAAVKAWNGTYYRYPLSIRFLG